MSLQFTNIDEAFSPLSQRKKKERKTQDIEDNTLPQIPQQSNNNPPQYQTVPNEKQLQTFSDELSAVQPYIKNLFMLLVLGMLYDIRQAALDCKTYLYNKS